MEEDRAYWLAWDRIRGMGPHRIKRLWQQFGSLQEAWQADRQALLTVEGIGEHLAQAIEQERRRQDPAQVLEQIALRDIPFLTPADADYPALLWELPDPPPLIYVWGDAPRWDPCVAIVGTRSPTAYGRRWTEKLAAALAEAGFVVVSGMAAGIDGVAHQACLQAGGRTLAVVGTGVDVVYPAQHRALYQRIRAEGAVVSEFAPGTAPAKENFPRRNRIVAGLCRATLVIEAPAKSGALITAYLANDYGRDVYALPGTLDTPEARGCLDLIRTGASLILGVEELLGELGAISTPAADPSQSLPGSQLAIWEAIPTEPIGFDAIAQATGLEVAALSSDLLMLELEGWIVQLPGMRYQRAPKFS